MIVVYIAGPFRAPNSWERELNIRNAESLAFQVWKIPGCCAICPHTNTRFFDGALPDPIWLNGDLELLRRADCLITTPQWRQSAGAGAEVAAALEIGMPVFHDILQLENFSRLDHTAVRKERRRNLYATLQQEFDTGLQRLTGA